MTISVDWADTKVVYIPKVDMTLVQSIPQVIYELDLNDFRLTLLDLQDNPEGRPWQKIYTHETETDLSGVLFARKLRFLAPYTFTFEDGQYAVRLTGANSNLQDLVNVNQVSVRPNNSAGLTSPYPQAILEATVEGYAEGTVGHALNDISYTDKFIFIDTSAPMNGNGKSSSPFNVVADAVDFAESVGWKKLIFLADATLERTLKNFTIEGIGLPTIDINGQNIDKSEFLKVGLTGHQVGSITAREIIILGNYTGANGIYKESGIAGNMTLAEGAYVTLASVSSLFVSGIIPNTIDMGAATTTALLNVRKLSGALLLKNTNTATKVATIEFSGGKIELDNSNTAGAIGIAGIPDTAITDNSNGSNVLTVGVFPGADTIADTVLDKVAP